MGTRGGEGVELKKKHSIVGLWLEWPGIFPTSGQLRVIAVINVQENLYQYILIERGKNGRVGELWSDVGAINAASTGPMLRLLLVDKIKQSDINIHYICL